MSKEFDSGKDEKKENKADKEANKEANAKSNKPPPLLPGRVDFKNEKNEVRTFKASDKFSKKTPRGKSYKPHEKSSGVDDPTKISAYVDTPEGMKPLGKYGEQGDDHRPDKGRRSVDLTRDIPPPPDPINEEKNETKRKPYLDYRTALIMKQAEAFLESEQAKEFVKSHHYNFNIHDARGTRTAQVTKSQHKEQYKIVLFYSDATTKSEQRKKVYVPESTIQELALAQVSRLKANPAASTNSAPTYLLKAEEEEKNRAKNENAKKDPDIKPILKPKPRG